AQDAGGMIDVTHPAAGQAIRSWVSLFVAPDLRMPSARLGPRLGRGVDDGQVLRRLDLGGVAGVALDLAPDVAIAGVREVLAVARAHGGLADLCIAQAHVLDAGRRQAP